MSNKYLRTILVERNENTNENVFKEALDFVITNKLKSFKVLIDCQPSPEMEFEGRKYNFSATIEIQDNSK